MIGCKLSAIASIWFNGRKIRIVGTDAAGYAIDWRFETTNTLTNPVWVGEWRVHAEGPDGIYEIIGTSESDFTVAKIANK